MGRDEHPVAEGGALLPEGVPPAGAAGGGGGGGGARTLEVREEDEIWRDRNRSRG
jgi:hypothetical protein